MKKLHLIILISLSIFWGCKTKTSPSHKGEVFVSIKTIQVSGGWGYRIYIDTTLYIDQPFIPSIGGKQPFQTESDAKKTAELVLKRMREGDALPSVSGSDLKELGIIKK